jgi:hypothetical protein
VHCRSMGLQVAYSVARTANTGGALAGSAPERVTNLVTEWNYWEDNERASRAGTASQLRIARPSSLPTLITPTEHDLRAPKPLRLR